MKRVALVAPFGKYKSFSICLEDAENSTATPLIYLTKSTFITEEEYIKLVKAFQIHLAQNYVPEVLETEKVDDSKKL